MKKRAKREVFEGFHNANLVQAQERLVRGNSYKDLSTVWITPTRGVIPAKVVSSWMGAARPMNQKFLGPIFMEGMEVGEAYNKAVEMIFAHPELSKFKYMLTVEEDNCPPWDGILKLYESIEKYDVVQGLYWTKGRETSQPMIYGDPKVMPKSFIPQVPQIDAVQEANGLGMGFNLWRLSIFKKVPGPWFKTLQESGRMYSQDLYAYERFGREGYRFACDTRIKVGHWSQEDQMMY